MGLAKITNSLQAAITSPIIHGKKEPAWFLICFPWTLDFIYSFLNKISPFSPSGKTKINRLIDESQAWAKKTGVPNEDKLAIVTGANSGIGFKAAEALGRAGYKTILACRNPKLGQAAVAELEQVTGIKDRYEFKQLDLASFDSIDKFVADINAREGTLDVLINNAGVSGCGLSKTKEGLEMHFGVNQAGPFILTMGLLDKMKANPNGARIVNVSSIIAWMQRELNYDRFEKDEAYHHWRGYGLTKLCNLLFATALARKLKGTKVTANAIHPGTVTTQIFRDNNPSMIKVLMRGLQRTAFLEDVETGAATSVIMAMSPKVEGVTGKFYAHCEERKMHPGNTIEAQDKLWAYTEATIAKVRAEKAENTSA
ncbi:Retinol dehydrogenase 13 [Coemansia sp. RSA 552]|nr:Retinol dehydrogenase 13 [Coemansia sp. RSA 552]